MGSQATLDSIVCVYDRGSVPPRRIAEAVRSLGFRLIFVVPRNDHCDLMCPILNALGNVHRFSVGVTDLLADRVKRENAVAIVTFSEVQIPSASRLAELLGLSFHPADVVPGLVRKDVQRLRLEAGGITVPRWYTWPTGVGNVDGLHELEFPAIVKPIVGAGSRSTVRASSHADAVRHLSVFGRTESEMIVEEELVGVHCEEPWGNSIGIDCVVSDGAVQPIFVTGKFAHQQPFRESGGYGPELAPAAGPTAAVVNEAGRAISALSIRSGAVGVEFKLTKDGPRVIEVNGRLGAWVDDLARRARFNDPVDIVLRNALGLSPTPPSATVAGIAFNYMVFGPPAAKVLQSKESLARLVEVPGVSEVQYLKQPGDDVRWELGSAGAVASANGLVEDIPSLASAIRSISSRDLSSCWA